ncbi:MAG: hypothetical protein EPO20_00890 [Betaproteobacteria bacterium]|nr:MAG: hypothetical protein EPO20_00890 [Betaproteobacteria bacterium]
MSTALRAGTALAATVALGYTACTLVFLLWPEIAVNFVDALFHGLEFRKLQNGAALFEFGRFFYVLVVLAVWAFWLGALFGWLFDRLGSRPSLALRRS